MGQIQITGANSNGRVIAHGIHRLNNTSRPTARNCVDYAKEAVAGVPVTIGQIQMDGARASLAGFAIQIHNGQHTSIRTARKCVENVKIDKASLYKFEIIKLKKMKQKIIEVQKPSYDRAKKNHKKNQSIVHWHLKDN